jgi:hypothetical protein
MLRLDKFNVRIVQSGDRFGRDDCLTHEKEDPLIEFYLRDSADQRSRGFFISRYRASTLVAGGNRGLLLEGSRPDWSVTPEEMQEVRSYFAEEIAK